MKRPNQSAWLGLFLLLVQIGVPMMTTALLIDRPALHALIRKLAGWIRRYLPAELAGTMAALLGIALARYFDLRVVSIALIGTWCEFVGFYAAIAVQEWFAYRRQQPHLLSALGSVADLLTAVKQVTAFLGHLLRNLLLEFGPAQLLDAFFLRPALLALAMYLIPALSLALLAGKLSADLFFYTVTISSFELRNKMR
jgi:hypothetical protein